MRILDQTSYYGADFRIRLFPSLKEVLSRVDARPQSKRGRVSQRGARLRRAVDTCGIDYVERDLRRDWDPLATAHVRVICIVVK